MAVSGGQGKDDASKIRRDPTVSDGGAYLPGVVVRIFRKVSTTPMLRRTSELTAGFAEGVVLSATVAAMAIVALFALFSCHVEVLNPDPVHGGQCHNGNQLSVRCDDGSCAPPGYRCVPQGGWDFDPAQWGPGDVGAKRDAGRD